MQEPVERGGKNWVLGVTALASFMMALDALVITTAFATIRGDFGASIETLQWTVNAYNLTFAVLLLTGAAVGDRFGRRRMFAVGIALFALASGVCALSGSVESLIAARSAQGAGAALVMPLAMAILSDAFAREERARALGIFSGFGDFARVGDSVALYALRGFTGYLAMPGGAPPLSPYVGSTDPKDPVLSPIYADLKGMPPALFVTSGRDLLLSGTTDLHRAFLRAGDDARLMVFDGLPHAFWYDPALPESMEANRAMAKFLAGHLK